MNFDNIENIVTNNTIEEIVFENLKHFYGCGHLKNVTSEELRTKYSAEDFNELDRPLSYFEENIYDIKNNLDKYKNIYKMLDDEESKNTFVGMMASKIFMDMKYIAEVYSKDDPYFSKNIFSFSKESYVDCGGYDGDTAVNFIKRNPDLQQLYIFEGIPSLAEKCKQAMEQFNSANRITVYQKAVFNKNSDIYFDLGEGIGDSRIKEQGEVKVQSVKLDDVVKERISFIKMDIEGSEKEAIWGAHKIIAEYTPKMAICIYHLKDDFWKIPELIMSINSNYRFKVRQCDPACFSETVLYCIPETMPAPLGEAQHWGKDQEDLIEYRTKRAWFLQHIRQQNYKLERSHSYNEELKTAKDYLENQLVLKNSRIDELEKWISEQQRGNNWLENQIVSKNSKIDKLEHWTEELEQGNNWLKNQVVLKNSRIDKLEHWTEELEQGNNWLENQVILKNSRIEELERWIAELEQGKDWLENQVKEQEKYIEELLSNK